MKKQGKQLVFTFEEVVVVRFALQVFRQTDFSVVAPEAEVAQAKAMAEDIYNQLTKVEHNLTFSQLCVIGGAMDNFEDLVAQGEDFELDNGKLKGYMLLLPGIQNKIKKMVAN